MESRFEAGLDLQSGNMVLSKRMRYIARGEQTETFAKRIKRLRETKGWSQQELAKRTEIAPAVLSRVLSGERRPRIEQVIAIANALDVTVTEFVAETELADIVESWVPRERFDASEKGRVEVLRELEVVRMKASSVTAEVDSLRSGNANLSMRVNALEEQLSHALADSQRAADASRTIAQLRSQLDEVEGQKQAALAMVPAVEGARVWAMNGWQQCYSAYERAYFRIQQLQQELEAVKGNQVAVGLAGGLLGALAGALVTLEAVRPDARRQATPRASVPSTRVAATRHQRSPVGR